MRRILGAFAVACVAVALVVVATGSGGSSGYQVRAIFNNASFVIPGMDVKIAGVKVGQIESLDLTANNKAAVVLNIENRSYWDFRDDAFCRIRPQSLIGEKFVDCQPTTPRVDGEVQAPLLPVIESGPGKGQRLLPATRTATSVDLDLVNNISRLPYRERLTIILNEFGVTLAGNGETLNSALKKTDPTLKAFDDVLAILARQNRTLASLAVNGDTVLQPLARNARNLQGFINSAGYTAQATAEESADFQENWRLLPGMLRELQPTMIKLGDFASAFAPVAADLNRGGNDISTFTVGAPAFNEAGIPALQSLGDTADVGGPALANSLPLAEGLKALGANAKPASTDLASLLSSTDKQGGWQNLTRFIYNSVGLTNGFDEYGHYARARLVTTTCQSFFPANDINCNAKFNDGAGSQTQGANTSSETTPATPRTSGRGTGKDSRAKAPRAKSGRGSGEAGRPTDRRSAQALLDYLLGQ
ncbi:MAG: MlaD family protein [Solirubrobacterales bacterium]